jgi:hypothetical protein
MNWLHRELDEVTGGRNPKNHASVMVVGCGRANGSGTEAVDASVDAYRHGEEGKKGLKVIARLWAKLWTIA